MKFLERFKWVAISLGIILLGIGVYMLTGGKSKTLVAQGLTELAAIRSHYRITKLEAEHGKDIALASIDAKYAALSAEHKKLIDIETEKLRTDPAALAAELTRIARS